MSTKLVSRISVAVVICFFLGLVSLSVWAEDSKQPEVMVVSASRTAMDLAKVASSVTVIDRQQIENRQSMFVGDLLRDVPGVAVTRSGSKGNFTEVRIRGSEANQVVVMIDGVRVNDPASADQFQWQYLTTNDIERIEVLRGPQSALWGADANGGVINITTLRATDELQFGSFFEAGSYDSKAGGGRIGGASDVFTWGLNGSYVEQDGFNVAQEGSEDDPYSNKTASVNLGFRPGSNASIDFVGRYTRADTNYDEADLDFSTFPATGSGLIVDADEKSKVTQTYAGLSGQIGFMDNRWTHQVFAGITDNNNYFYTDGNRTFKSYGTLTELKYQTNWDFARGGRAEGADVATFAIDYQERDTETASSFGGVDESTYMTGLVAEGRTEITTAWSLTGAVRRDLNSDYEDKTTWRATTAYSFDSTATRLRGAAGTGQKAPTASELYGFGGDFLGNPDLKPEETTGWEIGVDQDFVDGRYALALTYFREDLEDQITGISTDDPSDPGTPIESVTNAPGRSKRKGVEFSVAAELVDNLDASLAYTYLDSDAVILQRDFINNEIIITGRGSEIRRPRNIVATNLNYRLLNDRLNTNLNVTWTDDQTDSYFTPAGPTRVELDSYTLVDFTAEYQVDKAVSVYGRVNNMFDEDYEEVFSFNTPGRAVYAGVKVSM